MHRRRSPTHEGWKLLAQVNLGPADCAERFERARSNRWAIPHKAKSYFKTHLHQRFGGKQQNACFFDVVCQMGGIPPEFAAAWNEQTDVRLEVSWLETYHTPDLAF